MIAMGTVTDETIARNVESGSFSVIAIRRVPVRDRVQRRPVEADTRVTLERRQHFSGGHRLAIVKPYALPQTKGADAVV